MVHFGFQAVPAPHMDREQSIKERNHTEIQTGKDRER